MSAIWPLLLAVALLAAGCATFTPPPPPDELTFVERTERQSRNGVTVSTVVPDAAENLQVFGHGLIDKGVQPVWLEIDNQSEDRFTLLLLSIDPDYFSPAEAAWKARELGERGFDDRVLFMLSKHVPVVIQPGETVSGFVFTNADPAAKVMAVDLVGNESSERFEFLLPVPGFEADFERQKPSARYRPDEIEDLDLDGLRAYLEQLPCCALGGDRETPGDPLNLVIVGDGLHLLTTMIRRGWDLTETLSGGTAWRTTTSSLFGSRYRTSPVSPLYLFDRPQDVALQKARGTVDERNHLRLWRAPVTLDGTPVWVGQISRDIGVKFSSKTFVTHKIDPVVDEARFYVMLDVAASQFLDKTGYVKGVGYAPSGAPRYNYTADAYFTDGLRAILILGDKRRNIDEIEWLPWEERRSPVERK